MITEGHWTRTNQVDEAIKWIDGQLRTNGTEYEIDMAAFKEATGAGVVVTEEQIG